MSASVFQFNPLRTPFSRFGASLAISRLWKHAIEPDRPAGWYIFSVLGKQAEGYAFQLIFKEAGKLIAEPEVIATAGKLTFTLPTGGKVEAAFQEDMSLRFRVTQCELQLVGPKVSKGYSNTTGYMLATNRWVVRPVSNLQNFLFIDLTNNTSVNLEWAHYWNHEALASCQAIVDANDTQPGELVIASFTTAIPSAKDFPTFDDVAQNAEEAFNHFLKKFPQPLPHRQATFEQTIHVLWTSTVAAQGAYPTPAVLMSKNWMGQVWSWDHCFNAVALAYGDSELAWQQLMLPFRHQDEFGCLPDSTHISGTRWPCTKSPIHGWALRRMMADQTWIKDEHLKDAYKPMARWCRYWLEHRNLAGDGVPFWVHGNEQFDNTSLFRVQEPYRGADLAAYLVILQQLLGDIAERLGEKTQATQWREQAQTLLRKIPSTFWRKDHFIAPGLNQTEGAESQSVFAVTAMVLGKQLPAEITTALIQKLEQPGHLQTSCGALASEALDSPYYEDPSYVRGPIWAPPNVMIYEGLLNLGKTELAEKIRNGFCSLCENAGMFESFHAKTLEGLYDPAYTWTPSAYIMFVQDELNGSSV